VTHLSNYTFDGARADLSKTLSTSPAFQVTHSFAMGSQGGPMGGISPGAYTFGAVYATGKVRCSHRTTIRCSTNLFFSFFVLPNIHMMD
jgi:hypothetical protein